MMTAAAAGTQCGTITHHTLTEMVSMVQREFEKRVDPNDRNAQALLEEMRQHVKKARHPGQACSATHGIHSDLRA